MKLKIYFKMCKRIIPQLKRVAGIDKPHKISVYWSMYCNKKLNGLFTATDSIEICTTYDEVRRMHSDDVLAQLALLLATVVLSTNNIKFNEDANTIACDIIGTRLLTLTRKNPRKLMRMVRHNMSRVAVIKSAMCKLRPIASWLDHFRSLSQTEPWGMCAE